MTKHSPSSTPITGDTNLRDAHLHSDPASPSWFTHASDFCRGIIRDAWSEAKQFSPLQIAGIIAFGAAFIAVIFFADIPPLSSLRAWSQSAGLLFAVAFWLGYVIATQFPFPRTALTLTAGILFGPWRGFVLAITATTVSAVISLLIVRYFLGAWMAPRLNHPAVTGIDARLRRRGWLSVGSLRLIAGVPFCVLNYISGLTSVPTVPYALATAVGSAPGTLIVVLFGDSLVGDPSFVVIAMMAGLALIGLMGLITDARTPVERGGTPLGQG